MAGYDEREMTDEFNDEMDREFDFMVHIVYMITKRPPVPEDAARFHIVIHEPGGEITYTVFWDGKIAGTVYSGYDNSLPLLERLKNWQIKFTPDTKFPF